MPTLAELEKSAVLTTFRDSGFRVTEACRSLGISPNTLYRKLAGWGISSPQKASFPQLSKKINSLLEGITVVE